VVGESSPPFFSAMVKTVICVLVFLACAGCNSYTFKSSRLAKVESQLEEAQRQVTEKQRQYTTATVDALTAPGTPYTNANVIVATEYAKGAQSLAGMPNERLDVVSAIEQVREKVDTIDQNTTNLQAEVNKVWLAITNGSVGSMKKDIADASALLKKVEELEVKVQKAEDALVSKAAYEEKQGVKRFWQKTGFWTKIGIIAGGIIALCVFVPAVIPVLGSLIGWLIGKIPTLVSFVGVVGKNTFDAVVEGVGNAKKAVKNTSVDSVVTEEKETYTRAEVDVMLESMKSKIESIYANNLRNTTSDADKAVIASRELQVVDRGVTE